MDGQQCTDQSRWGLLLTLNTYTDHFRPRRSWYAFPLVLSPWLGAVPFTTSPGEKMLWGFEVKRKGRLPRPGLAIDIQSAKLHLALNPKQLEG